MKRLKIYKTDEGEFCLERINEFGHGTKRFFISEEGLLEGLDAYSKNELNQYEIEVESNELWSVLINHLNK